MRTSMGFWDAVFGKRGALELPLPDGTTKTVKVTEKWLAEMQRQGKITPVNAPVVIVHTITKLAGDREDESLFSEGSEQWIVGRDIQKHEYDKVKDEETGDLYAFVMPEDGGSRICCVDKKMWMLTKANRETVADKDRGSYKIRDMALPPDPQEDELAEAPDHYDEPEEAPGHYDESSEEGGPEANSGAIGDKAIWKAGLELIKVAIKNKIVDFANFVDWMLEVGQADMVATIGPNVEQMWDYVTSKSDKLNPRETTVAERMTFLREQEKKREEEAEEKTEAIPVDSHDQTTYRLCDVCNAKVADGDGACIPAQEFRALLDAGFGIDPTNVEMLTSSGMSTEEAVKRLREQYLQSSSDWLLCTKCAAEADEASRQPKREAVAEEPKSNTGFWRNFWIACFLLSVVAIIVGCVLLYLEMDSYKPEKGGWPWETKGVTTQVDSYDGTTSAMAPAGDRGFHATQS